VIVLAGDFIRALLISLCLVAAGLLAAQEPAGTTREQPAAQPVQGQHKPAAPTRSGRQQGKAGSSGDSRSRPDGSFTPSEEISEDLAVSFPADI